MIFFVAGLTREQAMKQYRSGSLLSGMMDGTPTFIGVASGPDGECGSIVGVHRDNKPGGYYPKDQTWQQIDSCTWVGYWSDEPWPPKPEALQRKNIIDGTLVELADGNKWIVPVARKFTEVNGDISLVTLLPRKLRRDADGEWYFEGVNIRYQWLWDIAVWWFDQIIEMINAGKTFLYADGMYDAAAKVLSANYRMSEGLASAMGIFDTSSASEILNALVDWNGYVELCQKKSREAGDSDSINSGVTGEIEDTFPHSPTC